VTKHEPGPIFLLSPAHAGGKRAKTLFNPQSQGALARRLQAGEAVTLGELFSFMSGLYFRGKLAYASRFAATADDVRVITPQQGLLPASTPFTLPDLAALSDVPIDPEDDRYRRPLEIDLAALAAHPSSSPLVLLGSLATGKYLDVLRRPLGGRLFFPAPFVGLGDMARGSLLLRHAREGVEMAYAPIADLPARAGKRAQPKKTASREVQTGIAPCSAALGTGAGFGFVCGSRSVRMISLRSVASRGP